MSNRNWDKPIGDYRLDPRAECVIPEQGGFRFQFDLCEAKTHNVNGEEIPVVECVCRWHEEADGDGDPVFVLDSFKPRAFLYAGTTHRKSEPMDAKAAGWWERIFDRMYDETQPGPYGIPRPTKEAREFQEFLKGHV